MSKSTRPVKPSATPPAPQDASWTRKYPAPIEGVIPFGTITNFSGAYGTGKTILTSEMLAKIRDGREVFGHATNPPTAFYYVAADRPWYPTYHETFESAGFPDIWHYSIADDVEQDPRLWRKEAALLFTEKILTHKVQPIPGSFVIFDPAYPLFIKGDQNNARDVATSLHWFRWLMRRFEINVLCMANQSKEREDGRYNRPQDRLAGSGAFGAYSDTQMYLQDKKGEGYPLLFGWKPRRGEIQEFELEFDPESKLFVPYTGCLDPDEPEEAAILPLNIKQVYDLIPDEGQILDTADLEELAAQPPLKLSRATVQRHLAILEKQGLILRPRGKVQRRKLS